VFWHNTHVVGKIEEVLVGSNRFRVNAQKRGRAEMPLQVPASSRAVHPRHHLHVLHTRHVFMIDD
jgi:hypothetical protein